MCACQVQIKAICLLTYLHIELDATKQKFNFIQFYSKTIKNKDVPADTTWDLKNMKDKIERR